MTHTFSKDETAGRKYFFSTYLVTLLIELALVSVASYIIVKSNEDEEDNDEIVTLSISSIYYCFVVPVKCYFSCVIYDFYRQAQISDDY